MWIWHHNSAVAAIVARELSINSTPANNSWSINYKFDPLSSPQNMIIIIWGANHPYSQLRAELRRTRLQSVQEAGMQGRLWLPATSTYYDHGAQPGTKVFEGGKTGWSGKPLWHSREPTHTQYPYPYTIPEWNLILDWYERDGEFKILQNQTWRHKPRKSNAKSPFQNLGSLHEHAWQTVCLKSLPKCSIISEDSEDSVSTEQKIVFFDDVF